MHEEHTVSQDESGPSRMQGTGERCLGRDNAMIARLPQWVLQPQVLLFLRPVRATELTLFASLH